MSKPLLVLGNKNYSSWSLRAYLALHAGGIDFDEKVIPLDTPEFARTIKSFSPTGRVPVLIAGELVIWESLAIVEYAAEQAPSLWPQNVELRARARAISAEMHSGFGSLRSSCPMNIRATGRRVEIDAGLDNDIARVSAIWEQSIERSGGPYLFGQFTAADAMYAPVASRFRTYDFQLSGAASAYVQNIHDHPSFKAWQSEALKETWIVDADEAG